MKLGSISIFIFIFNIAMAQPQIEWIHTYGTEESEIGLAVLQTDDGGYIAAGGQDLAGGNPDWLVYKVDADGALEWNKNLGTTQYSNRAYDIKQTLDGGYALTGSLSDTGTGSENFVLVKLDSEGEIEWQKFYGLISPFATSLSLTADGGYIIAGNSWGLAAGSVSDGLFRKLDSEGNLEWEQQYGGSESDEIFAIQQTSDLGYIATGCSRSSDGDIGVNKGGEDIWVIKMDVEGALEWSRTFGGSLNDISRSIDIADDGGYVVAGYSFSNDGDVNSNYGNQDIWLFKLDVDGNLLWENNYGGSAEDRAQAIYKVSAGGFVVGGWTRSNNVDVTQNKGLIDIWIFKIDDDGNMEWEKNYGGSGIDQCLDIKETEDGGYIATGNTYSSNGNFNENFGSGDFWMMKLMPLPLSLQEENYQQAINLFPNPNSGNFSIDAPNINSLVNIRIYDLQGKNIYVKRDADLSESISVYDISKGLYFIELTTDDQYYLERLLID